MFEKKWNGKWPKHMFFNVGKKTVSNLHVLFVPFSVNRLNHTDALMLQYTILERTKGSYKSHLSYCTVCSMTS